MGKAKFNPKWWTEEQHGSAWERVKFAMQRDWEQTKSDFKATGRDLNQGVGDTVKQAAGKEPIPPINQPNPPSASNREKNPTWDEVEAPLAYGYSAQSQYGTRHANWDDKLETTLRQEWEEGKEKTGRAWDDVRGYVRRGYEHRRR